MSIAYKQNSKLTIRFCFIIVLSSWPKLGTSTSDAAVDDTAAAAAAASFSVLFIDACVEMP